MPIYDMSCLPCCQTECCDLISASFTVNRTSSTDAWSINIVPDCDPPFSFDWYVYADDVLIDSGTWTGDELPSGNHAHIPQVCPDYRAELVCGGQTVFTDEDLCP